MSGFEVPVAILNFNRPHLTRRVFDVVKQIKPKRLLLIADGPRASMPDDVRLCAEVRAIFDEINWDCEVSRKFSDTNLGSFKSNSSGLNWVFETVEEAIIIEDDCVPSLSFFPYCKELLQRYRDDPRVALITGYNLGFPSNSSNRDSYFFSAYALTWAWASWRRTWQQVDLNMTWWNAEKGEEVLRNLFPHPAEWRYWHRLYESIQSGSLKNAWDYQLILSSFRHGGYCAIPRVNLVSNIGFGDEGTNCRDEFSPMQAQPRGELIFPLRLPNDVMRSAAVDHEIFRIRFMPTLWRRAINKLVRVSRRIMKRVGRWL